MAVQKAQADALPHRLHYALPGWDAAAGRRDAQGEFHSAAAAHERQGRGRGLAVTPVRTTALGPTEWAARPIRAGRAAPGGRGRRL
jgi:hypothetical protein